MAKTIADIRANLTAVEQSLTDLEARESARPEVTQGDLDEVAGRVAAIEPRLDAILPETPPQGGAGATGATG